MGCGLVLERYLNSLLNGDRCGCRAVIEEAMQSGVPTNHVYMDIIWPIMVEIENLARQDRITPAQEAFASRINRTIIDQLQNKLPRKSLKNKKAVICSAANEQAELGGQIATDLFESDGWESRFLGSRLNYDDLIEFVHSYRPDILVLYGMGASDTPLVRNLIDTLKDINACPQMRIMLAGGIFNRAPSLWEEIGADLHAEDAAEAVRIAGAEEEEIIKPERTIKRRRKVSAPRNQLEPEPVM